MQAAGLPPGFYDQPSDFTNWISKDVAPQEISQRVDIATQYVNNTDPSVRKALSDYYGVGDSELVAYALDQNRAVPLLQKQANAVKIGAAANQQGLTLSKDRAELFADQGAAGNAGSAYSTIAQALPTAQKLASIYGQQFGQADLENEFLGGSAAAKLKQDALSNNEVAAFSGNGGATRGSLGRTKAGSY